MGDDAELLDGSLRLFGGAWALFAVFFDFVGADDSDREGEGAAADGEEFEELGFHGCGIER